MTAIRVKQGRREQNMNEVSLGTVYKEIIEVKKKLETIEDIIIPGEKVSEEELNEITQLKEESLKGEYVKWSKLKKELSA
ncbi:MAG: hypothetical protein Q8O41_03550 [Candidatus Methanoperedens sp.]|nr:hypothetical protein [Candidatus Methanoperedens sp.]